MDIRTDNAARLKSNNRVTAAELVVFYQALLTAAQKHDFNEDELKALKEGFQAGLKSESRLPTLEDLKSFPCHPTVMGIHERYLYPVPATRSSNSKIMGAYMEDAYDAVLRYREQEKEIDGRIAKAKAGAERH